MENQTTKSERPTFLTVICILSFIGLGWDILSNIISAVFGNSFSFMYSAAQSQMETALNEIAGTDPAVAVFAENMFESFLKLLDVMPVMAAISIFLSSIALTGAILMWNLKKIGFYLFSGAKVIMIFVPVLLIGPGLLTAMMAIGMIMAAGLFITLYAFNFKHLK